MTRKRVEATDIYCNKYSRHLFFSKQTLKQYSKIF